MLRKIKDGYKVCKKKEPSVCFSKNPLPLKTAEKQRTAILISEAKQGGRLSLKQQEERDAEWKRKNEEAKAAVYERTSKEAKEAKASRLDLMVDTMRDKMKNLSSSLENLRSKSADLKSMLSKKTIAEIKKNLQSDLDKIEAYDFYNIENAELRNEMLTQYSKMLTNMKNKPKVYGHRPESSRYGSSGSPSFIKFVYENYGKPEPEFLDTFASLFQMAVSTAINLASPGLGFVFDALNEKVQSWIPDEANEKVGPGEEVTPTDIDTAIQTAYARQRADASGLERQSSDLEGQIGQQQQELIDTQMSVDDIARQARELRGGLLVGDAKPLTARLGGKTLLKKTIVDKFFPSSSSYDTYVEPFVGGGSVYFYKDKDDHKEIVNDLDPLIYTIFKGFQKFSAEKIADAVNGDYDKNEFIKITQATPNGEFGQFIKQFLINRLSYFAKSKAFGKPRINSTFEGYQERLKDAVILKTDWKKVVDKYNVGTSTFFYLDPPMAKSDSSFEYDPVDLSELKKMADKIDDQGNKFLITIPSGEDLFKSYDVHEVKTNIVGQRTRGGQTAPVNEFIITNYRPGTSGSGKPKMVKQGDKSSDAFMKQLEKLEISPDDYMKVARHLAKSKGYEPEKLSFASDGEHKLLYDSPEGLRKFGRVNYGDFIIWSYLERMGKVPKGYADKKRNVFHKSHKAMSKEYGLKKYSPNELALNINW